MVMRKSSRRNCFFLINWLLSLTVIILLSVNLYITLYGSPFKVTQANSKSLAHNNIQLSIQVKQHIKDVNNSSARTINNNDQSSPLRERLCDIPYQCKDTELAVRIQSGPFSHSARICVNGKYYIDKKSSRRGFNMVVINPMNKKVVNTMTFDIYKGQSAVMVDYIESVADGYFFAIATADDAFFRISEAVKQVIEQLGSVTIHTFNFRTSWVFVGRKGTKGATLVEEIGLGVQYRHGSSKSIATCIPINLDLKMTDVAFFCENHSEFEALCKKGTVIVPPGLRTRQNKANIKAAYKLPIAIIAGNRPFYLQRCIESLLRVPDIDPSLIVVFIDGFVRTPVWLANLYGIRTIVFPKSVSKGKKVLKFRKADQVALHYRRSLGTLWEIYAKESSAIILEDDLIVSPDILNYFSQTLPILQADKTILTITAWNSNGYKSSSYNNSLVYRSEYFPGMGWILTRKLWDEIAPKWPRCCQGVNWDDWLRLYLQRRQRDIIYPDVSRTYHIGFEGVIDEKFYKLHFENHHFNTIPNVKLWDVNSLKKAEYDKEIERILKAATPIRYIRNNKKKSCNPKLIPNTSGKDYAIYFYQNSSNDYRIGQELCTCCQLWNVGQIRGLYRGTFRFYNKKNHIIAVGSRTWFGEKFMPKKYANDWLSEDKTQPKKT